MPRSSSQSRSISISGDTYDSLHAHCVERRITTVSLIESLLTDITGKEANLQRRPRKGGAEQVLANSCAIDVSADLVRRIDDHLATYPLHKRPSRKRFVDKLMADCMVWEAKR